MRWLLAGALVAAVLVGPRRAEAGAKRYAVLRTDATLRLAPKASATGYALGLDARKGDGVDVEVVGSSGDFYEVRNIESGCYSELSGISSFELTFYVAKSEVQPVLTEQLSLDLGDGERLEAKAGALVKDGQLHVVGVSASVALPDDVVGLVYRRPAPPSRTKTVNSRLHAGQWSLGDVVVKAAFAVPALVENVGAERIATIEHPCLKLQFRVGADDSDLPAGRGFGRNTLAGYGSHTLAKETTVYWPDGGKAGRTRSSTQVGSLKPSRDRKKRSCFERTLGVGKVTLCAATKSFKEVSTVSFGTIGGVIGGVRGSTNTVYLGGVSTGQGLDKSIVRRYLRRSIYQWRSCHTQNTTSKKKLRAGRLDVRFSIDGQGRVATAAARRNTTGSKPLASCVVTRLKAIRFPRPQGQATVKASFKLTFRTR